MSRSSASASVSVAPTPRHLEVVSTPASKTATASLSRYTRQRLNAWLTQAAGLSRKQREDAERKRLLGEVLTDLAQSFGSLKPEEIRVGMGQLADRWNWHRSRVRRLMHRLEDLGLLRILHTRPGRYGGHYLDVRVLRTQVLAFESERRCANASQSDAPAETPADTPASQSATPAQRPPRPRRRVRFHPEVQGISNGWIHLALHPPQIDFTRLEQRWREREAANEAERPERCAPDDGAPMRDLFGMIPPDAKTQAAQVKTQEKARLKAEMSHQRERDIQAVFAHWVEVMGKNGRTTLDPKRRKNVNARLDDGYSVEELMRAIDGCRLSPHNMGRNANKRLYNDLELICRDAKHVEEFRDLALADQQRRERRRATVEAATRSSAAAPARDASAIDGEFSVVEEGGEPQEASVGASPATSSTNAPGTALSRAHHLSSPTPDTPDALHEALSRFSTLTPDVLALHLVAAGRAFSAPSAPVDPLVYLLPQDYDGFPLRESRRALGDDPEKLERAWLVWTLRHLRARLSEQGVDSLKPELDLLLGEREALQAQAEARQQQLDEALDWYLQHAPARASNPFSFGPRG